MRMATHHRFEKLKCGHIAECQYFHPALKGASRWRCVACDDPNGNTRAMQELIKKWGSSLTGKAPGSQPGD